jgi:acetyl-CoA decarbonylase/synthase complex subunit gamma
MSEFEKKKSDTGPAGQVKILDSVPVRGNSSPADQPWVIDSVETAVGKIPVVGTELKLSDKIGSWKARWSINRNNYKVIPGLYAVGKPHDKSPVFVTANYKMSFDRLRSNLKGMDGWIMVLDTKGINVWCAAGKGTFGTDEIVFRTRIVGLDKMVTHRRLILPQLGAPGVSAHKVKEKTGFRVIYGPIRANDIPEFMSAGMKATPEMRRVTFNLKDRMILIPNDLIGYSKYAFIAAAVILLLSGFGESVYSLDRVLSKGLINALLMLIIYTAAASIPITILPWLPGKSFSAKGGWAGVIIAALLIWILSDSSFIFGNTFIYIAWILIILAITSFVTMNYTGSSTYTSLSGVRKEMKIYVPLQIISAFAGLCLFITGLVL